MPKTVVCHNCGKGFEPKTFRTGLMEGREIEKKPAKSVAAVCPHCKAVNMVDQ